MPEDKAQKNREGKRVSKEIRISDKSLVTKGNQLIEAQYKLSLREQRFVLLMASMIEPDDERFTYYKVPTGELIKVLGWERDKRAYERLRKMVDGLMGKKARINEEDGLLTVTWVASSKYLKKESAVEFEFSERLKPYLIQLKGQFTRYRLKNVVQLRSAHTIRIYELLKQYEVIKSRRMTLGELRAMLGIENARTYDLYGNLKSKILIPAQTELANKTDIAFTFDEIKEGRKVVAVRFHIEHNEHKDGLFPTPLDEPLPLVVKEMVQVGVSKRQARKIWREKWGFLNAEARQQVDPLITDGLQFDQYVRDKLELLNKASKQGDIPSRGGWISKAIKENWTNAEQDKKRKRVRRRAEYQRRVHEEEVRRDREDAEARNKRARDARMDAQYIALSPTQQERINRLVVERLLTMDDFTAQRIEIRRVVDEVNSGEHLFRKLPAGVRVSAQRIRREIVATIE